MTNKLMKAGICKQTQLRLTDSSGERERDLSSKYTPITTRMRDFIDTRANYVLVDIPLLLDIHVVVRVDKNQSSHC